MGEGGIAIVRLIIAALYLLYFIGTLVQLPLGSILTEGDCFCDGNIYCFLLGPHLLFVGLWAILGFECVECRSNFLFSWFYYLIFGSDIL